jgi:hypothetical protein
MTYNFRYDPEKNTHLILTRGIGFEDVIEAIQFGDALIDIKVHPSERYPHQQILIVYVNDYYYGIPCVPEWDNTYFMKTIIPNRKYKKQYC